MKKQNTDDETKSITYKNIIGLTSNESYDKGVEEGKAQQKKEDIEMIKNLREDKAYQKKMDVDFIEGLNMALDILEKQLDKSSDLNTNRKESK